MKKPVPNENQWGSGTVLGIIKNPVYKGELVSSKRSNVSYKNKRMVKNPSDMWVVVENAHDAIINKTTWESAQKKATKKTMLAYAEVETGKWRYFLAL